MLAYMNRESLEKTIETGFAWYYSAAAKNSGKRAKHLEMCSTSRNFRMTVTAIQYSSVSNRQAYPVTPARIHALAAESSIAQVKTVLCLLKRGMKCRLQRSCLIFIR